MNALVNQNCREAGAVVLKLAYGYTVEPHKQDPLVDLADVSMYYFSLVCRYGAWVVDVIPSCTIVTLPAFH